MDRIDENKAIARREIEDFEGKGNVSLARELFAADYKLAFGGMPTMDCAGHEQLIGAFRTAFPDLQIRVTEQVAAADRVGNHWVAQGTHRGAFQGIPATDKAVTITGNNVMHIADDRIRAIWGQFDAVGLMAQLGAIPGPVPAYAASDTRSATSSPSARGSADVVRRFIAKFNEGRTRRDRRGVRPELRPRLSRRTGRRRQARDTQRHHGIPRRIPRSPFRDRRSFRRRRTRSLAMDHDRDA